MKTLLFAQQTHLGVMFETQISLLICTWCSWVILLTLEYEVHVIFIPLDIQKVSPLKNTEVGTALIHHVHVKLSWSSLVIEKCPNTPVIRSLIYPFFHSLPPMIYIINKFLKYY